MSILGFALVSNCSRLAACRHRGYRSWMEEGLFKSLESDTKKREKRRGRSALGLADALPPNLICERFGLPLSQIRGSKTLLARQG